MQADFWHQRWQDQQTGFHLDAVNPYLARYWQEMELAAGSLVFVPLCGKSIDLLWLRDQGYRVLGVEISPLGVEAFFRENGLQAERSQQGRLECWESDGIRLLCGDFFHLLAEQLAGVAAIYDRASLVALPPAMRQSYVSHMQAICPDVAKLLITLEYDQAMLAGPPFAVSEAEVHELYDERYTVRRLQREEVLDDNPRFRDRGLSSLSEVVYRLEPRI